MDPVIARPPRSSAGGVVGFLAAVMVALAVVGCGGSSNELGTGGRAGAAGGRGGGAGGRGGGAAGAPGTGGGAGGKAGSSAAGGAVGIGGASAGGATGHGGLGGTAGSSGTCSISLRPLSHPSFYDIEAGPDVKLTVQALGASAIVPAVVWHWQVTLDSLEAIPADIKNEAGSIIEFPLAKPGNYRIIARIEGDSTCQAVVFARAIAMGPPALIFRSAAPGYPVQDTRVELTDEPFAVLSLTQGLEFSIRPQPVNQDNVLVSYVRISSPATRFVVEGDTAHGPLDAVLFPYMTYDLLLVPNDPRFAPELLTSPPTDWPRQGIMLDQGIAVSGTMLDGVGAAVPDARLVLRRGQRPSTVGISARDGQLNLRTRSGTLSALVVPPTGSGLPQATVGATGDAGIVLPPSASSMSITMRWNMVTRGAVTVAVRGPEGATPVPGARVRLTSRPGDAKAGTLTASVPGAPDATFSASGSINVEQVTDSQGAASFGMVAEGDYSLTVVPPSSAGAGAAITTLPVTVPAAGVSPVVTLAQKVTLSGTLAPLPAAAGAAVTAVDTSPGATGTTASVRAGSDGHYSLAVDPGRDYALIIAPSAGQSLGRTVLRPVTACKGPTALGTTTLPNGLSYSGLVMGTGGQWLGGTFIQVFCVANASSCTDPTVPLGEATTRGDGRFTMTLPDLAATAVLAPASVSTRCQ